MKSPSLAALEAPFDHPFFRPTLELPAGTRKVFVRGDDADASDSHDGSLGAPVQSLHAPALRGLPPGTGLIIHPSSGGYTVPDGGFAPTGSAEAPTYVLGWPGVPPPVLDGRPYTHSGAAMPLTHDDIRVRQLFDLSGAYVRVEGLDLRHGFRHLVVCRGRVTVLRRCRFSWAFEDAVKIANTREDPRGADDGLIEDCDFSAFASQGIDCYGAADWLVRRPTFHDPIPDVVAGKIFANAIGLKGGARHIVITQPTITALPGAMARGALVIGGAGNNFETAVEDCVVSDALIRGYAGPGVMLSSAWRCGVYRTRVSDGYVGVHLGIDPDIRAGVTVPTCRDVRLGDNMFAIRPAGAQILVATATDGAGFVSGGNTYLGDDRFFWGPERLPWAAFCARAGTDATSRVAPLAPAP